MPQRPKPVPDRGPVLLTRRRLLALGGGAFVLALASSFVGPINIGTGKETTLREIAAFIAKEAGVGFVNHVNTEVATHMQADAGRADRILGWHPLVDIGKGLHEVIDAAKSEPVPAQ